MAATGAAPAARGLLPEPDGSTPVIPAGQLQSRSETTLARALASPADRELLPQSVMSRLTPLLGRDPGPVRLLRGAAAAEATAAARADALAVGDLVLLGAGHDLATPAGLGLLAHELTHVLRRRDPGFIPAVVQNTVPQGLVPQGLTGASTAVRPLARALGQLASQSSFDEEGLAEHVERLVHEQVAARRPGAPAAAQPSASLTPPGQNDWGGLPAPWEPMPYWDAPAPRGQAAPAPPRPAAAVRAVSAAPTTSAASAGPVAQAASVARSAGPASGSGAAPGPAPVGPAVGTDRTRANRSAPDLDLLAQQVYGLLKRRLSTEVRRDR